MKRRWSDIPLVRTIRERCRVCYTCVRECPAKAIRIADGQAEVLPERCIGCGNCVRVCSQHAKQVLSAVEQVRRMLAAGEPVAACIAPSFPAEFPELPDGLLVAAIRRLGFQRVQEVAFGADLVAERYRRLLDGSPGKRFIATSCPAIVGFIERYYPNLVDSLAPIVSPMVATARALRRLHGPQLKVVFLGPCIAKKGELSGAEPGRYEVDAALTFVELREMFAQARIDPSGLTPEAFDPPHGGRGALLAVARGMIQAARINEDLMAGEVVAAEGRTEFVEAIDQFEQGSLDARLLEVLCCHGCITGAGMTSTDPLFARQGRVSQHARRRMAELDLPRWRRDVESLADLDLSRRFLPNDQRIPVPFPDEITQILARMGKFSPQDELNCGACGYETCREHAQAIFKGLAESEMCLPYTIERLRRTVKELAVSNEQLASAQEALMQSEKLASMGQLAAGIAHEVNNPLGVVLMYAHLLLEECPADAKLREDLAMIADQADRCKTIVSGLLHFARQNKVVLQETHLPELIDRSMRVIRPPDNVRVAIEHRMDDPMAQLDRDQIVQVLTNLATNAFAAMPDGGQLTVRTSGQQQSVQISVADTGVGIPAENLGKVFEPFFTTKQIGKGTGLGLAVTYGIVKMHRGDVHVTSNADPAKGPTGTTFVVVLPRQGRQE